MRYIFLFLTTLVLFTSCGQGEKVTTQAIQSIHKQNIGLSLPEDDIQLLKCHNPGLLKKIREPLSISIDDIIILQQLGFTSDIVIMIINHTDSHFQLSTIDILRLQAEGVSFKVINYMIRT